MRASTLTYITYRHSISSVPILSLNKLESLALELFSHDLSIPSEDWMWWLTQVMSYHVTSSSPAFPQPISRPSTSPFTIVRKSIETLMEANAQAGLSTCSPPVPIFLGLEERQESVEYGVVNEDENVDVLEIDLDEDGPLREEYLPRRRVSGACPTRAHRSQERNEVVKTLPPPARWSPESDEPITRGQLRAQSHLPAPQPIAQMLASQLSAPFHQVLGGGSVWTTERHFHKQDPVARPTFLPPVFNPHSHLTYPGYDYTYPPPSHLRSQSLTFNQSLASQAQGHYRTYSHSRYDGGYNDFGLSEPSYMPGLPPLASNWNTFDRSRYSQSYDCSFDINQRTSLKV